MSSQEEFACPYNVINSKFGDIWIYCFQEYIELEFKQSGSKGFPQLYEGSLHIYRFAGAPPPEQVEDIIRDNLFDINQYTEGVGVQKNILETFEREGFTVALTHYNMSCILEQNWDQAFLGTSISEN